MQTSASCDASTPVRTVCRRRVARGRPSTPSGSGSPGGHARPPPTLHSILHAPAESEPSRCTYPRVTRSAPATLTASPADLSYPALNVIVPPPHLKARTITAHPSQTYLHSGRPPPPATPLSGNQMGKHAPKARRNSLVPAAFTLHTARICLVDEVSPRSLVLLRLGRTFALFHRNGIGV